MRKNLFRNIFMMALVVMITLSTAVLPLDAYAGVGAAFISSPLPTYSPVPIFSRTGSLYIETVAEYVGVKDGKIQVNLIFYLVNDTEKDADFQFNTSQKFDYTLTGEGYSYHYGDGKVFLQVITFLQVKAGEKVLLGKDTVSLPEGSYFLRVSLKGYRISSGGVLMVKDGSVTYSYIADILSSLVFYADVDNYFVKEGQDNIRVSFFVKNKAPFAIEFPEGFTFRLSVVGGHGHYLAYVSGKGGDTYLTFTATSAFVLESGEERQIGAFLWDQLANVKGTYHDVNGKAYQPLYAVNWVSESTTISVDGVKIPVSGGIYKMSFPIYDKNKVKVRDVPDWAKEYVGGREIYFIPSSTPSIDARSDATRLQVIWSVFLLSGLHPEAYIGTSPFPDVSEEGLSYMDGIFTSLKRHGVLAGFPDGTLRALIPINRAETAALFIRMLKDVKGVPFDRMKRACQIFKDMDGTEWFSTYVCYARWIGLLSGYPDGTFRAKNFVKVSEVAKMVASTLKFMEQ